MSLPLGTDVLTSVLAENPLAGSVFERQDVHSDDKEWQEEHQHILERENSRGNVQVLDAEDMPTFYTGFRLVPLALCLAFAGGINGPVGVEFLKIRVCEWTVNLTEAVCTDISEPQYKHDADKVVAQTAHYQLFQTLVGSLLPVVFSLFVGSWSDKFGRKLPMIIPFVGLIFSSAFMSVLTNFKWSPLYLLVPSLLQSLTGGWTILLMSMFSYIGDYTTDKNRAINIAMVDGTLSVGYNVGGLLGGYLFKLYGFQLPFYICTGLHTLSFIYILLIIRDRRPREKGTGGFMELISVGNLRDNWKMLRKKRTGQTRQHIWMVLTCLLLFSICDSGDGAVTQLFVEFLPFRWTVTFFTLFSCISGLWNSFCLMISMLVFRKYLGISDTMVAFVGSFSAVLYYFGFGIARVSWVLYASAALGSLRLVVIVSIRSLLSGLVDQNEIGKSMSLISSLQSLTPLAGGVVFNDIFAATSSFYSGLCYLIAAPLAVIYFAIFGYIDVVRRGALYSAAAPDKVSVA